MDSKLPPTRLPEDLVQPQTAPPAQQFAPRNPVGQPAPQLNPIGRRPSIPYSPGEIPLRAAPPPQTLQRLDSRQSIQLQPQQQQPQQPYPNQVPGGQLQQPRIIQQRPIGAPTPQPQQQHQPNPQGPQQQTDRYQPQPQQQPRIDNPNRPQLINRAPGPPQLINRPAVQPQLINRPAIPPGTQLTPQQQQPQPQRLPLQQPQQQQQQINPPSTGFQPNQQQQPPQQGPGLNQQPIRVAGTPQLAPNQIRNIPPQYRVPQPQQFQAPVQPRPTFNNPINPGQKLPTHLEERSKMAAEINAGEKHQPSYIISNSDDVDDVIVRPITQSTVFNPDTQPKVQQPLVGQQPIQRPPPNVTQSEFRQSPQQQQEPALRSSIPRPTESPANGPQKSAEPVRQAPPSNPVTNDKKPTPDSSAKKQNGSAGKPNEKGNNDGAASISRASSHKSQEDVMQRSSSRSRMLKLLEKPAEPPKKVSMNKIKVGNAPPPNLRQVRSKIGSLDNATHKPGGGNIKIETKKLEFKVQPRIEAKNDTYAPKGGDKKIISNKLQWNAKSKIGSLDNANHKPGGGDKKILTIKSDFRENAKPKVGSKSANNNNNDNDAAAAETVNQ